MAGSIGKLPQELRQMNEAVGKVWSEHPISLSSGQEVRFEGVSVSGDWAVTGPVVRDQKTGALMGGENFLIILRRVNGTWVAAYPNTPDYAAWLPDVPDALVAPESKQVLR